MTLDIGNQIEMGNSKSFLCVYGTMKAPSYSYSGIIAMNGTIELKGNLESLNLSSASRCTVIFSGGEKQVVSGDNCQFPNVYFMNTSDEGVVLDTDVKIFRDYHSPLKKVDTNNHKIIISSQNAQMFEDNYYGDITINCVYSIKHSVTIDGNVIIEGANNSANSFTIPKDIEVNVSGSVTTKYGGSYSSGKYGSLYIYGKLNIGKNLNSALCSLVNMDGEDAYLLVNGDIDLYSGNTTSSECNILNGTVEAKGNIKNFAVPKNSKNILILSGDKLQTLSQSTNKFNIVEITNDSEEGVEFSGTVYTLFNHNQKIYSASGSFPDYDGDGLKDNVDPYPLVGNICRIDVSSESSDKGNVSDSIEIIGGTTVEVTAIPNKGYAFDYWENQSGKKVNENSTYCFVARSNEVLVAHFKDVLMGDVNLDGSFNVSDVILLQKWLLAVPNTHLSNWSAADFCEDDKLDVFDLCLMKRALIEQNKIA